MLKVIKQLLERSRYGISIALTFLIIYLSLGRTADIMTAVQLSDKSLHGLAYFGLTLSWIFAVQKSHSNFNVKIRIGLLMLLLGVLLEFAQGYFTDYRSTDYYDILANLFGIVIAVISFRNWLRLYNAI